jgi:hypothetical protein
VARVTNPFDEGPEIYHGYSVDDEDQPQGYGDSLSDERGLREPLDEGYSPPGRWSSGQRFGNTAYEEATGETLAQRLAQEEPDTDPYGWPASGGEGRQVGGIRAGHLKAYDLGPQEPIVERAEQSEWAGPSASLAGEEPYWDRQVGGPRAGRLLSSDEGVGEDVEKDVVAFDVGIDGAGASAEEAAMHVIEDDSWSSDR